MKPLRTVLLPLFACALVACASTDERSSARVSGEHLPRAASTFATDDEYVARVEAVARRRGIDVQWVHVPQKRVARSD